MKKIIVLFIILLCLPFAYADLSNDEYDAIIINSYNWDDVYAGVLFSKLNGIPVYYISAADQTQSVITSLPQEINSILLLESSTSRASSTIARSLRSEGYTLDVESYDAIARYMGDYADALNIILVDNAFPGNGLAVAPYAAISKSWVLFVDTENEQEALDFLSDKNYNNYLYYGTFSDNILTNLPSGETFNKPNKFNNNIDIAEKFLELQPVDQVVLSDGAFIEEGFFDQFPVLLIGETNLPRQIVDYVIEKEYEYAVVVGTDAIDTATLLKNIVEDETGRDLTIYAKVAKTKTTFSSNEILGLDKFYLPNPQVSVTIPALQYNSVTRELEIVFANDGDIRAFFVPTLQITINGQTQIIDSLEEFYVLLENEFITLTFPIDIDSGSSVSAIITTVYGEDAESFDYSRNTEFSSVPFISVRDQSSIEVVDIYYDNTEKAFVALVNNNGSVEVFVDLALDGITILGEETRLDSDIVRIAPGQTRTIVFYQELSDLDLQINDDVNFFARFGQREDILIKVTSGTFPLRIKSGLSVLTEPIVIIPVVVVLVFIILLIFLFKKTASSYTCASCGQTYTKKPKNCTVCGYTKFNKR